MLEIQTIDRMANGNFRIDVRTGAGGSSRLVEMTEEMLASYGASRLQIERKTGGAMFTIAVIEGAAREDRDELWSQHLADEFGVDLEAAES